MKTIITLAALAATLAAAATPGEIYQLKSSTRVSVVDESGKHVEYKRLPAGTKLTIYTATPPDDENTAAEKAAPKKQGPKRLKPSGISPAIFLAEKPTGNHTFIADINLETSPYYSDDIAKYKGAGISVNINAYGKTTSSSETLFGYALRASAVGKALRKITADGEKHGVAITVRLPKSAKASESLFAHVIVVDVEELPIRVSDLLSED